MLQDELDRRRSRLTERRFERSGLTERLSLAFQPEAAAQRLLLVAHPEVHRRGRQRADHRQARHRQEPCGQGTLQGYDVRYVEADTELIRYGLASTQEQAEQLKAWIEPDLQVLDDLLLARRIADISAELLQAVVHQSCKLRRAIVISSNRVVQDWGKYLGDAAMVTTIFDRLMHRCAMLEFEGKSYRLKEAASRIAVTPV